MKINKQIVLDIETTGLNLIDKYYLNNKIIEICAIEIKNKKITNNIFHTYLNPNRKIEKKAYEIHKIKNSFLKKKPKFKNISKKFINFIKNSNLIIHNAKFDIKFIEHELKLINYNIKINKICNIIDTLYIARKIFPGKKNDLNSLCNRYKINIKYYRKNHGALIDAKILANIYLNLIKKQTKINNLFIKKNINIKNNIKINNKKIIINKIKKKENKIHLKYLKYIKKKYKKCIWN